MTRTITTAKIAALKVAHGNPLKLWILIKIEFFSHYHKMLFPFEIIAKAADQRGFYNQLMNIAMFESRIVFMQKQIYFALRDIAFTADDDQSPFYIFTCDNITTVGNNSYCSQCYKRVKTAQGCHCAGQKR